MRHRINKWIRSALPALVLTAGLTAAPESPTCSASFRIPFAFSLGDAEMPASTYVLQNDREWAVLWVCADGVRCSVIQSSRDRQLRRAEPQLVLVQEDGGFRLVFVQLRPGLGYRLPGCSDQSGGSAQLIRIAAEPGAMR